MATDVQQQAGIERRDVEMQHGSKHAFLKAARITALKRFYLGRRRASLPRVVILLEKQQVDFRRGATQRRILEEDWKRSRLLEIGRQQLVGQALRLAQVVLEISAEARAIVEK